MIFLSKKMSSITNSSASKIAKQLIDQKLYARSITDFDTVDKKLQKYGYVRLANISLLKNIKYVKCISMHGDFCFIDFTGIDDLKYDTQIQIESTKGYPLVPTNVQNNLWTQIQGTICTAMFEYSNEYCHIKLSENGKLISETYKIVKFENTVPEVFSPTAFPVVKFSDVEANNTIAVQSIRAVTSKIQHIAYEQTIANMSTLLETSQKLVESIDKTLKKYQAVYDAQQSEHELVLSKLDELLRKEEKTPEENIYIENCLTKLKASNRFIVDLLNLSNYYNKMTDDLNKNIELSNEAQFLAFKRAQEVLAHDNSDPTVSTVLDAGNWDLPTNLPLTDQTRLTFERVLSANKKTNLSK